MELKWAQRSPLFGNSINRTGGRRPPDFLIARFHLARRAQRPQEKCDALQEHDQPLRRLAVVMLQQTAQLRFTTDFRQGNRDDKFRRFIRRRAVGDRQWLVLPRLMWPSLVVKLREGGDDVVEMLLPEEQEVIERLDAQRLNHAFDESIGVRRAIGRLQNLAADGAQGFIDLGRELRASCPPVSFITVNPPSISFGRCEKHSPVNRLRDVFC